MKEIPTIGNLDSTADFRSNMGRDTMQEALEHAVIEGEKLKGKDIIPDERKRVFHMITTLRAFVVVAKANNLRSDQSSSPQANPDEASLDSRVSNVLNDLQKGFLK